MGGPARRPRPPGVRRYRVGRPAPVPVGGQPGVGWPPPRPRCRLPGARRVSAGSGVRVRPVAVTARSDRSAGVVLGGRMAGGRLLRSVAGAGRAPPRTGVAARGPPVGSGRLGRGWSGSIRRCRGGGRSGERGWGVGECGVVAGVVGVVGDGPGSGRVGWPAGMARLRATGLWGWRCPRWWVLCQYGNLSSESILSGSWGFRRGFVDEVSLAAWRCVSDRGVVVTASPLVEYRPRRAAGGGGRAVFWLAPPVLTRWFGGRAGCGVGVWSSRGGGAAGSPGTQVVERSLIFVVTPCYGFRGFRHRGTDRGSRARVPVRPPQARGGAWRGPVTFVRRSRPGRVLGAGGESEPGRRPRYAVRPARLGIGLRDELWILSWPRVGSIEHGHRPSPGGRPRRRRDGAHRPTAPETKIKNSPEDTSPEALRAPFSTPTARDQQGHETTDRALAHTPRAAPPAARRGGSPGRARTVDRRNRGREPALTMPFQDQYWGVSRAVRELLAAARITRRPPPSTTIPRSLVKIDNGAFAGRVHAWDSAWPRPLRWRSAPNITPGRCEATGRRPREVKVRWEQGRRRPTGTVFPVVGDAAEATRRRRSGSHGCSVGDTTRARATQPQATTGPVTCMDSGRGPPRPPRESMSNRCRRL